MYVCMHACRDGWMDGWMDGCMDGWMDGWMSLSMSFISQRFCSYPIPNLLSLSPTPHSEHSNLNVKLEAHTLDKTELLGIPASSSPAQDNSATPEGSVAKPDSWLPSAEGRSNLNFEFY